MHTRFRAADLGQLVRTASPRAAIAGAATLCLITAPRAAYAHDDDAPATPEKFWTGWALFVLLTVVLLVGAFRARLPARRRLAWSRYRRRLRRKRP